MEHFRFHFATLSPSLLGANIQKMAPLGQARGYLGWMAGLVKWTGRQKNLWFSSPQESSHIIVMSDFLSELDSGGKPSDSPVLRLALAKAEDTATRR